MRRRTVEVEVTLLDVLAVVALAIGQAEQALFQDRVGRVPQRQREAQPALAVGDAEQAILAPAVGPAAGLLVREVIPRVAVGRVILAHGAPLALGEIRSPALPVLAAPGVFEQALTFRVGVGWVAHAMFAASLRGRRTPCAWRRGSWWRTRPR